MPRPLSEIHAERLQTWRDFQETVNDKARHREASYLRWLHDEWRSHPQAFTKTWASYENQYRTVVDRDLNRSL